MTVETAILENLEKLPEPLKVEVLHYVESYVESLVVQHAQVSLPTGEQGQEPTVTLPTKYRRVGAMKSIITIADDFDER